MLTAIYSKKFVKAARDEEGLTAEQAKVALASAPPNWLKTIVSYIDGPDFVEGEGVKEIRAKFPTDLPGDDQAASFLLRIAANEAGGLVV